MITNIGLHILNR